MLGIFPYGGGDFGEGSMGDILSLPYVIQRKAARKHQDLQAAMLHLVQAYRSKDEHVRLLLEQAGAKSAIHKASRDIRRFPEWEDLMLPILYKSLASDLD